MSVKNNVVNAPQCSVGPFKEGSISMCPIPPPVVAKKTCTLQVVVRNLFFALLSALCVEVANFSLYQSFDQL